MTRKLEESNLRRMRAALVQMGIKATYVMHDMLKPDAGGLTLFRAFEEDGHEDRRALFLVRYPDPVSRASAGVKKTVVGIWTIYHLPEGDVVWTDIPVGTSDEAAS